MGAREFGAVIDLAVVQPAQVTHVVEQSGDQTEHGPVTAQSGSLVLLLLLVSNEQARKSERDIERVLSVVINRVDAQITGYVTGEETLEMLKGRVERLERKRRPGRPKQGFDGGE